MGSTRVEAASRPGFEIGFRDEETVSTIATHDPAPASAASDEAAATSFKRIDSIPLFCTLSTAAHRQLARKRVEEYHMGPCSQMLLLGGLCPLTLIKTSMFGEYSN
jgi:hypothetical protein